MDGSILSRPYLVDLSVYHYVISVDERTEIVSLSVVFCYLTHVSGIYIHPPSVLSSFSTKISIFVYVDFAPLEVVCILCTVSHYLSIFTVPLIPSANYTQLSVLTRPLYRLLVTM